MNSNERKACNLQQAEVSILNFGSKINSKYCTEHKIADLRNIMDLHFYTMTRFIENQQWSHLHLPFKYSVAFDSEL